MFQSCVPGIAGDGLVFPGSVYRAHERPLRHLLRRADGSLLDGRDIVGVGNEPVPELLAEAVGQNSNRRHGVHSQSARFVSNIEAVGRL